MDFANGLFQRGFYAEAAKEYRAYIKQYPKGEQILLAFYRLGEAEYTAGHYSASLKAMDRFVQSAPPDHALLPRANLRKGEALYHLKRFPEAIQLLQPLTDAKVSAETRASALYYLGKMYYDTGKAQNAQAAFKALVNQYPRNPLAPYARYQLANALLALGDLENAAIEFSNVAGSKAEADLRMDSRYRAAEIYDKINWHGPALKAYQQLLQDFPHSAYAQKAAYGYTWALYHAGKFAAAAQAAAAYVKANPQSPDLPAIEYLEADCLQEQRQYGPALDLYREIGQKYPQSAYAARAQYRVAWVLYLSGQTDEAKAELTRLLQQNQNAPQSGDAAFLLGSIDLAEKDYAGAAAQFEQIVQNHGASEFAADALFKLGECQGLLGQTAEAAKTFEAFAKRYPDNPLVEQAVLRAGNAQFLTSAFAGAIKKYKQILTTTKDPATEEDTLYRLALAYHNAGQYKASADTFRTLLSKYPRDPHAAEAHLRIGDYRLEDGHDPVKAAAAYEAVIKAGPKGPFAGLAMKGLGLARYETKDYDGAAESFLEAMTQFPDVSLGDHTYAWVGQRMFDQSKWDQAATAFAALLRADPKYAKADVVRLKLAEARESAGKTDEAMKLYQALADKSPATTTSAEAKYRLAKLLEGRKDVKQAVKLYKELATAGGGDTAARAQFRLGEIAEAKGDFEGAATRYMRVAILFLDERLSPESLWRAGQCFEKVKNRDEARKSYRELLKDFPKSPQAVKAKERLAQLGA